MKIHRLVLASAAVVAAALAAPLTTAGAYVEPEVPPAPTCTLVISASSRATLVVGNQVVACLTGVTVNGSIMVQAGGALLMEGGLVTGNVTAYLAMCGVTVRGAVATQSPNGFTHLGDVGDGALECAGNTVANSVSVLAGEGGYMVNGNQVRGNVTVNDNSGRAQIPVPYEIAGNTIGGQLTCLRDNPPPTDEGYPNIVTGAVNCTFAGVIP